MSALNLYLIQATVTLSYVMICVAFAGLIFVLLTGETVQNRVFNRVVIALIALALIGIFMPDESVLYAILGDF